MFRIIQRRSQKAGLPPGTPEGSFNMPELNWSFGYPFALGLMVVLGVVMLLFFKKKKWI